MADEIKKGSAEQPKSSKEKPAKAEKSSKTKKESKAKKDSKSGKDASKQKKGNIFVRMGRAIAKFYTALDAEMGGVQLLKTETVENAAIPRRAADDPLDPAYIWPRFGLGFVTGGTDGIYAGIMGHGGAVGAEGLIDRKNHLALGFTRNRIDPRHPNHPLRDLISEELNLPIRHW